jgi:hypothetical protein
MLGRSVLISRLVLTNANAGRDFDWGRAPIHLRYRFILRGSAKPVLDYLINIAEFAEFDRICIFLSVVSWSGIMKDSQLICDWTRPGSWGVSEQWPPLFQIMQPQSEMNLRRRDCHT